MDSNGKFMEMSFIRTLQDRHAGAETGFGELQRYITEKQFDLEYQISLLDMPSAPADDET
jgi:hypothetical protein